MCGILGVVKTSLNNSNIYKAFKLIQHRGPDGSGIFENEKIILGTHRLKIQDLSTNGDQPMSDASGRYIIIYNGEIYNHWEIRKILISKGYSFKSTSDTETILIGYIHYGKEIVNKLKGMFAFAIYDQEKNSIFGAKDPIGVKPLYYYLKGKNFAFSSEIKSLIYINDFDSALNYKALTNYLNFLWSPGNLTPFNFVYKLLPGEYFTIDLDNPSSFSTKTYYDIPFSGSREFYNDKIWIDTIDSKLEHAVSSQLLSDVPFGFFLSGGIDSSVIVAEARKSFQGSDINCFTIKGDNDTETEGFNDDYNYAREAANFLGVNLHVVDGSVSIINDFDKMIWHLDEPQADVAPLFVYKVCEAAREQGINVLLSGAGGDDVFSGYRRHQALHYDKYIRNTPEFIFPLLEKYLRNKDLNKPTIRRLNKFLKRNNETVNSRMVGQFEWFPIMEHMDLFNKDIQHEIGNYNPDSYLFSLLSKVEEEENLLNKMLYLELKTFLVDHNLNYTDKMGMACGVEIRVPYLDIDLVNLSTKLPPNMKMRGNKTKYVLRKIAERYLPQSIVNRSKTGFGAPIRKWIKHDLNNMVNERLNDQSLNKYHIFDHRAVLKLIEENRSGKVDGAYTILSIMAIQSWLDQFYQKELVLD